MRLYQDEIRAVRQSTILLNLSAGTVIAFLFADLASGDQRHAGYVSIYWY